MGVLEKDSARRTRADKIKRAILQSVAAAGVLSVALLAPNALQMLKVFGVKPYRRQKEVVNRSRYRLVEKGFLKRNNRGFLQLTEKGETKLRLFEQNDFKLSPPKRWDKKWRILIFDIPISQNTLRDKVRRTLIAIGFERLQQSVWIYPYDCEDLITLLKVDFKIGKNLLYLIADRIENDQNLRESFQLKV